MLIRKRDSNLIGLPYSNWDYFPKIITVVGKYVKRKFQLERKKISTTTKKNCGHCNAICHWPGVIFVAQQSQSISG